MSSLQVERDFSARSSLSLCDKEDVQNIFVPRIEDYDLRDRNTIIRLFKDTTPTS